MLDPVIVVVEVNEVQCVAVAYRNIRTCMPLGVGCDAHAAAAARGAEGADGDHRKVGPIHLGQHDVVSAVSPARAANVGDENVVAVVDRHARKR